MAAVSQSSYDQPAELMAAFEARIGGGSRESLYGADQAVYQRWREKCVDQVVAGEAGRTLGEIIAHLGNERCRIARELGSQNAEEFGVSRCDPRRGQQATLTHLASARYGKLNQKLRAAFLERFPFFQESDQATKVEETPYSRVTFQRFDQARISREITELYSGKFKGTQDQADELVELFNSIMGVYEQNQHLFPDVGLPPVDPTKIVQILERSPLQFLVAKIETKVKGDWKPLTSYMTSIVQSDKGPILQSAVEYFKRRGFITLKHTPRSEIKVQVQAVERLAKKLLNESYDDPKAKLRDISFLQYRLFHLTPYNRGSASVVEIIMEAIYKKHGFSEVQIEESEAFSQLFIEQYINELARNLKKSEVAQ